MRNLKSCVIYLIGSLPHWLTDSLVHCLLGSLTHCLAHRERSVVARACQQVGSLRRVDVLLAHNVVMHTIQCLANWTMSQLLAKGRRLRDLDVGKVLSLSLSPFLSLSLRLILSLCLSHWPFSLSVSTPQPLCLSQPLCFSSSHACCYDEIKGIQDLKIYSHVSRLLYVSASVL